MITLRQKLNNIKEFKSINNSGIGQAFEKSDFAEIVDESVKWYGEAMNSDGRLTKATWIVQTPVTFTSSIAANYGILKLNKLKTKFFEYCEKNKSSENDFIKTIYNVIEGYREVIKSNDSKFFKRVWLGQAPLIVPILIASNYKKSLKEKV